jgi:long-subunit fatty acid transport protein
MGGGAYALRSLNYNSTANPALWSDQVYTRLSGGGSFERTVAESGQNQASQLTSGSIKALKFSFPLLKRTLGVGFTFQPYTEHNYRLRSRQTLSVSTEPNPVTYEKNFQGQGGLHTFRGGVGYRITDWLSLGASMDVMFGILQKKRRTEFDNVSFRNVTVSDDTRLFGVSGSVGAHLAFADVFLEEDALSLGASAALPTTLSGTRVFTRGEGRDLTPDTLQSLDGEVSLPFRGRAGVAYQPNARWTFTADGLYEPWSNFSATFGTTRPFNNTFPVNGLQSLTDRWRISVGTELLPAGENTLSGYFANIAYRLGIYTERLYVRPDQQTDLQTYAVTTGFSFPTSLSGTRIDLNLRAGRRGTTENALVQDTFYGVALHINFGERWFRERKLR